MRRLALRLVPATIRDLATVMRADSRGRPPLASTETDLRIDELVARATSLEFEKRAPRPLLMGRHLIALGHQPGPRFKPLLDEAFEAQLDGAFSDEDGALKWVRSRLQETAGDLR